VEEVQAGELSGKSGDERRRYHTCNSEPGWRCAQGRDIDALVELAKTLQEKTGNTDFVESMLLLIYELLPTAAREQILADGRQGSDNVIDFFTRTPRG